MMHVLRYHKNPKLQLSGLIYEKKKKKNNEKTVLLHTMTSTVEQLKNN